MNSRKIQDRLYWGLGRAARFIGQTADAFRPAGAFEPLAAENRFLRLPALFEPPSRSGKRANGYGEPLWYGVFDGSYTKPGDYIVVGAKRYFIASQDPMLPILCVLTNRTISIYQQTSQPGSSYAGYTGRDAVAVMAGWPASVLDETRAAKSPTDLPTDQAIPYWTVLLPAVNGVVLVPGLLTIDDLGRRGSITGTELTELGWRLSVRMMTT